MSHKQQQGFTLMELLVYISLVAGVLLVATTFAWSIIESRTKSFVVQEVQQNERFIIEKITQAVRGAADVTVPAVGVTDTGLTLASNDIAKDPVVFSLDTGTLSMSEAGGASVVLHSDSINVTDLQFTNLTTPNGKTSNVRVSITLEHINPDNRTEWEFTDTVTTTIELRDR